MLHAMATKKIQLQHAMRRRRKPLESFLAAAKRGRPHRCRPRARAEGGGEGEPDDRRRRERGRDGDDGNSGNHRLTSREGETRGERLIICETSAAVLSIHTGNVALISQSENSPQKKRGEMIFPTKSSMNELVESRDELLLCTRHSVRVSPCRL